jgi:hypothetical protein
MEPVAGGIFCRVVTAHKAIFSAVAGVVPISGAI